MNRRAEPAPCDTVERLRAALLKCADAFGQEARLHLAKNTPEAGEKAERAVELAEMCVAALVPPQTGCGPSESTGKEIGRKPQKSATQGGESPREEIGRQQLRAPRGAHIPGDHMSDANAPARPRLGLNFRADESAPMTLTIGEGHEGQGRPASAPAAKSFRGNYLLFRKAGKGMRRLAGDNGGRAPRFRHPTRESAEAEAVRLLERYPESTFIVLQEVGQVKMRETTA